MAAAPRDSAGMTPLMLGTLCGDILKVRRLVQMGADVNEVTAAGVSALHIAAERSLLDVADMLITARAVHGHDDAGQTPLHRAVFAGNLDMMLLLLEGGAQEDACDCNGHTALHVGAHCGHMCLVRELLRWGADAAKRDVVCRTPQSFARMSGHESVLTVLAEHIAVGRNSLYCEFRK